MRFFGSVLDPTSSEGKYRDRPFSVFFLHVLKDVFRVEDVAIFQLYMTVHDSIQFAKVARKLCLRKREFALTSNDPVKARKYRKLVEYMLVYLGHLDVDTVVCSALVKLCIQRYYKLILVPKIVLLRPPRLQTSTDEFSANNCKYFFEFRQNDLHRLFPLLHFPEKCVLDGGSAMSDEEVFPRGLYELVSGDDQHNISGREQTSQSRAFKIFGFIDCNCLEMDRVSGGPR